MSLLVPDAPAMEALGAQLVETGAPHGIVYLQGELGTGKTTLVRGLLRDLGYRGKVKSPTFTLIEPYHFDACNVYHLDLYRLGAAEELEWLGLRDLLEHDTLLLIEWPERGAGILPGADLVIRLDYHPDGRTVQLEALTPRGRKLLGRVPEDSDLPSLYQVSPKV